MITRIILIILIIIMIIMIIFNTGATELVGTKFLQPYMHGFFMDHRPAIYI